MTWTMIGWLIGIGILILIHPLAGAVALAGYLIACAICYRRSQ